NDSLTNYNNGNITVSYHSEVNGCATTTGPTNAGFVPYQDQTMYIQRGFGYDTSQSATTGDLLLKLQTAGNNPTPTQIQAVINTFAPYLAPETNKTSTSEIKALAVQSPTAGMLSRAVAYFNTNPSSSNGCAPQRYVILLTDGLPTEDLSGKYWPPLGSQSAAGYGVTASFNADGSLNTTNDQALTDTITELTALQKAGVKTYIVGVGAGVDPSLNPQAAATMTAMAVAGGTTNYYAATSPAAVALDMTVILAAIEAQNMSTSSAAVNSTSLNNKSVAYQAQFTSATNPWQDWTGNLVAYPINSSTGKVNTTAPIWSAAKQLDTQISTSRLIATWNPVGGTAGTGVGVPFEWAATVGSNTISSAQETELETSATDTLGPTRLAYLRGNTSNEVRNGGTLRSRSHILGDIVDSNPVYVGAPSGPYQSASYINFEIANQNREPMLYVGANDGMLHAFNPTNGNEQFAFVPNGVFADLINLTKVTYNQNHQFFVDGSPTEGDVQFSDGSWHSILVGGLNAGGDSIYALNVTNPAAITSESTLASNVLWEYSDPTGSLGLTYSEPFIAYTSVSSTYSSTPFLVFFGSGYNNSNGNPYLYAVNAQTGALIARINLCAAVTPNPCNSSLPNGLSSPVAVNSGGALYMPDDRVYAGDLQGNLWKVDISNPNPANWTVQLLFQARDGAGNPQPITTAPDVSLNPQFPADSGPIVYVGTGQLLGTPDLSTTGTQSIYGVWDKPGLTTVLTRSHLQMQTISATPTAEADGTLVRTVSRNQVNWATQDGWYEDLPASGERVVANPELYDAVLLFTTYVPSTNSCAVGGQAWLMAVNYATGGGFPKPVLDVPGDGLELGAVYAASPTIMSAALSNAKANILVSESNGQIANRHLTPPGNSLSSWRELPASSGGS
ncbi:MAG: pilus assembly protein, partial [Gammaproteobacteria bacterium]